MTRASRIEPITANGTLFAGLRASPARLIGLWKPLNANTMPLVATAVSTDDQPYGANVVVWPKFSECTPVIIRPTIVAPGIRNLKIVIAELARANSLTPQ